MDLPLKKIAQKVGGKIIGDDRLMITGVNSLDAAESGEISFFADRRFKESLKKTEASAVIITEQSDLYDGPQMIVSNAALAFAKVISLFAPPVPRHPGISERAVVHESSRIGKDVSIYPMVYVGSDAVIGDGTVLFPGVFVGDRVKIGSRSVIYPNVTILEDCLIGNDVMLHAGVVIGSDGFGYVRDGSRSVKIPQIGIVQIDDHVEIGANSCIDRAALGRTWLKRGVKVDNLVQVAHNVVIGEDTVVVAQTGFSGSVNVGREVVIAGQVGIADHIDIGDGAIIGSKSGLAKSVLPGEILFGSPAIPHRLWLKTSGLIKKLPQFNERLRDVEKRINELEKKV
ncbi:MAG: UDP-3-O-(3-hydroxymyristoyl)glucosamine N-acyltransferase [Deltaproteobacteria bacterium]|nr:UDP-3-O-(3-hydroxymyristoyl)glucosamine N-acyltransferase [Deltaproteobacteria bacterium]